ncbi:MAG: hypothetical protein BMS9Abin02_1303 [Anaerolineae bacterium]|nr:MAG: hypothetical protein BMS9Abin02_1303 [Anaerolineae bacterium]
MKKKLILALIILTAVLLLAVPVIAQDEEATGVITGRIINRTQDGSVPEKLDLMLHAWDENFDEKFMLDTNSKTDGTFEFREVSLDPKLLYAVMLTYDDTVYASEPVTVIEGQTKLSLEIPIYESTTDTSSVKVERQHILFDTDLDGLMVAEIYILSNTGDRTIIGQANEEDAPISSLMFSLPEDATKISFNETSRGGRFILTPGGFVDTAPVRPGSNISQVVVTYVLPYEDGLTYSWVANWPVERLNFMVTSGIGLALEGDNLTRVGTQQLDGGGEVDIFSHESVNSGDKVTVALSGTLLRPLIAPEGDMTTTAQTDARFSSQKNLALGGVALGLVVLGVGVWWYRRPDPEDLFDVEDKSEASYDQLLTQIALLDEAHDRGEINSSDYISQRATMVQQAKAILAPSSEQDEASPSPSY